jgi:Rieske Fe-S protein
VAQHAKSGRNTEASRRAVVGGILGVGVGVPLLASCGSDDEAGDSGSGGGASTASGPVGKTSDVPVGGGKIFTAEKVVVTQPTEGDFKAFSSICTHQGCPVTKIDGENIDCTCHGSKFSITDGSVVNGPATKPLSTLSVKVSGTDLIVT